MRAYSLGLYEKAMPTGLSWEKMLECTAASGFDTLEISIDESDHRLARLKWDAAQRSDLRKLSDSVGVPITVSWRFNGSYSGEQIEYVTATQTLTFGS